MPRYADIDKLLETFDADAPMNWTDTDAEMQEQRDFEHYRGIVENAPTADVVEVVRCGDCKEFCGSSEKLAQHCRLYGAIVEEDDFCSHGERKEK